ncbi:aspartate/glutamate racemase family protein [Streptomyces sp. B-S-A8]|uniref:Aspartate/glutamate racemase family protein n=1 Tax=Streptomyces solicavernae TaxID=3043614 RepID=A0ABT6RPC1_9ACTN|nr:aspartate/glutamate racemase family protein [Streptomyces sp. B-S-A8]MDI3386281.1 aspartate/glutamate racemase family protein [Streptomyces sp. B-S-A8]
MTVPTTVVALINPNTSQATTDMMAAVARRTLRPDDGYDVRGLTVAEGPAMLVTEDRLLASAPQVVRAAQRALAGPDGARVGAFVVSAFGDPGVPALRALTDVPVVGIAEAAMAEAAASGRRFGIATTTPDLTAAIAERVDRLGWSGQYTGIRLTPGDPLRLAASPDEMTDRLAAAVEACVTEDGAEAVVIGGGPLGESAEALRDRFPVPVIGPIPAACARVRALLEGGGQNSP